MCSNSLSSDRAARDNDEDEDNSVLSVEGRLEENKDVGKDAWFAQKEEKECYNDLEDTIQAAESKRSEQEEVRLNLERELL
jgi:hypothetical protein